MSQGIRSLYSQEYLSLYFRLILGIIFIYAGIGKAIDPKGFSQAIYNYHLLPGFLINIFALILPWIEIIAGLSLILGLWTQGGSLIISGLLFMFVWALGISLFRGLDISCGCFNTSPAGQKINWLYITRDLSLLTMGCFIFLFDKGLVSLDSFIAKRLKR